MLLQGKTILITGASSGIGRAIVIACASEGADLILCGRDHDRLNETARELRSGSGTCLSFDISELESIPGIVKNLPQIDGFVNSAGINDKNLIKSLTGEKMYEMFDTNFFGPVMLTKSLIKEKKLKAGASLVYISSIASTYATISNGMYAASKGAIESFARVAALELAPRNIRVNTIRPGIVNTPLLQNYALGDQLESFKKQFPLGRVGEVDDIAQAALFLLSDKSSWITGQTLTIDGGITLR